MWLIVALALTSAAFAATWDFDDAGRADIIWRNLTTNAIAIWLMNGPTIAPYFEANAFEYHAVSERRPLKVFFVASAGPVPDALDRLAHSDCHVIEYASPGVRRLCLPMRTRSCTTSEGRIRCDSRTRWR